MSNLRKFVKNILIGLALLLSVRLVLFIDSQMIFTALKVMTLMVFSFTLLLAMKEPFVTLVRELTKSNTKKNVQIK